MAGALVRGGVCPSGSEREPRKEFDRLKPWGRQVKYKLEAEEELQKIEGYIVGTVAREQFSTCFLRGFGAVSAWLWGSVSECETRHHVVCGIMPRRTPRSTHTIIGPQP